LSTASTSEECTIGTTAATSARGAKRGGQLRPTRVDLLRSVWERRLHLAKCAGVGLALATAIALLIPNKYRSTTQLMPTENSPSSGLLAAAVLGSNAGASPLSGLVGLRTPGALYVSVLESRAIGERLVERFELRKVYRVRRLESARKALATNTEIADDRRSGIITIRVSDEDPQRAAALANGYVEELNRLLTELNTTSAHRERVFLEERLTQVKSDVEQAERTLGQFSSKNATIDIKEQGREMVDAAVRLQTQLIGAEAELAGLRQTYADDNTRVRTSRARAEHLQAELHKMGGLSPGPGKADGSSELYPSLRKLPLLGAEYADLYRRALIQSSLFEILTKQYELAKVAEAREMPTIKVLDAANVPEIKSFPPRLLIVLSGGIVAFLAGALWVASGIVWEAMDPSRPSKLFLEQMMGDCSSGARTLAMLLHRKRGWAAAG
jgi:uncharacterized protein involved in exopolysaccharide biosynthesis